MRYYEAPPDIRIIPMVGILSPAMISGIPRAGLLMMLFLKLFPTLRLVLKGNQIFSILKRRMAGKFLEKSMERTRFGKTEQITDFTDGDIGIF
jgi:hypothetical protein